MILLRAYGYIVCNNREVQTGGTRMNIRKILIAGLMFILMIIIGTAGYEWTEHLSFFNALWLTVVSILTIGYGDMYPVTFTGKIFTLILIPIAIGLVTYILAQFAAALIEGKFTSEVKRRKMNAKINRLHQHIIVCGYGRVGKQVISQLEKEGKLLVVIEKKQSGTGKHFKFIIYYRGCNR